MSTLQTLPLFSHLSAAHLENIAQLAQPRHLAANSLLWTRGDQLDALVVLTRGRFKVILNSEDGREVTLNVMTAPSYLGDMSVLERTTHSATVMAIEPCDFLWIPGSDFRHLMEQHPRVVWELLVAQTMRVRILSEELASLAFLTTCRRVARKILQLAGDKNVVGVSHQELAGLVGSTRESVTRALSELEHQGLLHTHKGRVEVVSAAGLRGMLEET